jgi:hypothetical protein
MNRDYSVASPSTFRVREVGSGCVVVRLSAAGTEQLSHAFGLIDILPWGRREEWLDSPEGWPSRPTYSGWLDTPDIARAYAPKDNA